ncbi:amidohydrolase [Neobacillus mesonae]|uniref:amidohydrolase n=1 Tax=Neobacillus mesonae TaxID=1193713 RepID=UPI002E1BCB9F|nr:amidohydrolase [Neobacillus mesonae]
MVHADLLLTNANVLTLDENGHRAGSVAVKDGRIVGIWEEANPPKDAASCSASTQMIDLKGATLIPGFIDTHNHLPMYALTKDQVNCSSPLNRTISDIQQSLLQKIEQTPKGEWVLGYGYDDTLLQEKRHPTREDLDAIAPDHPVCIKHISAHLAVANSKALQMARVSADQPDPAIGYFGRDQSGRINGVLYEFDAMESVYSKIPEKSIDEQIALLKEGIEDYLAQGITTNTDAGVGLGGGIKDYDFHLQAIERDANPLRMQLMVMHDLLRPTGPFANYTADELDEEIQRRTNGMARLDSAKLFQDGSIQGLTGALRKPYECDAELYGALCHDQQKFNEEVYDLHRRGFRIAIHGNGDRAIGSILDALEYALSKEPRNDHRHRIEHVQTATLEDLDRMARLGVAGSFFINHVYFWGDRHEKVFLGPDRAKRISPLADAIQRNLLFTLHSDCPVTPISPLFSVWAAVNRLTSEGKVLGADQRIEVETALRSMTIYGAQLNFDEAHTGSIEIGKKADFAILEADPTRVNPIEIKDISVLMTIIGGKVVYEKGILVSQ